MDSNETYMPMKEPKYCFVSACKNNSRDTQKAFFAVPNSAKSEWCNAVRISCPKRVIYVCEDHLNLEEDVENYRYWITMNVRPKLKSRLPRSLVTIPFATDYQENIEPKPGTSSTTSSSFMPINMDMDPLCIDPITTTDYQENIEPKPGTSSTTSSSFMPINMDMDPLCINPITTTDYQENIEPKPSTSSTTSSSFMPINMDMDPLCINPITIIASKGVQVKPRTSDQTTYCAIYKKKAKKPLFEEDAEMEEVLLPSRQGSSTSAEMSEVSSEIQIKTVVQGRRFMLGLIKKKSQNYIGLPKNYYWLINYLESNLNVKSFDIIVTLYKIKNNTPFYQISDMFEVSLTTLWRIFFRTLCILSNFFKQLIFSPRVYDVKRNLPDSFKTNKEYSNVFCIIDCFEIEIEKPSKPINQSLTWSQYKNAYTLKYLIATTPDGFVNFVSVGFGGRISDAKIVENSGFLDVLPPRCTVLADRGFKHVDALLSRNQNNLLRPPSISKDQKFTKQDAIRSKVIASLRIHVERVIRRVRLFKFLKPHSVINNKLIQHVDDAVIVACGLINLHSSIIKNE